MFVTKKEISLTTTWLWYIIYVDDTGASQFVSGMTTASSGTYSKREMFKTFATDVNSDSATNGQVLTADGNGGETWQNVSCSQKIYKHSISIFDGTGTIDLNAYLTLYTTSNTSFNASSLITYISQTENNKTTFATGYFTDDNVNYNLIYNLKIIAGEMNFSYLGGTKTLIVAGVNDKVTEI